MAMNIKIGIVSIPTQVVRTINARDTKIEKHKIHLEDKGRIGHKNYCKDCGKEVLNDEIGTIYKDKVLTDEQIENIKAFMDNGTIEVLAFKESLDVNSKKEFFLSTYYLLPDISKNAKTLNQKNFYALRNAIQNKKAIAICLYTFRGNQSLALLYFENDRLKISLLPFGEAFNKDILRLEENLPYFNEQDIPTEQAELFIQQNIDEDFDLMSVKNTLKENYDKAIEGKLKIENKEEVNVFLQALKPEKKKLKVEVKKKKK